MARFGGRQSHAAVRPAPQDTGRRIVSARLTPDLYEKASRAAEALDISLSALLCELVEHMEVDAAGVPSWESKYARPKEDDPQQSLELSA